MQKNMGNLDKSVRVLFALIVALLYYFDKIQSIWAYVLMGIAIILLITSLLNYCPLYKIFGINTDKSK